MIYSLFDKMHYPESEIPHCVRVYDTLHPELKRIIDEVSACFDIVLIEGYRNQETQERLHRQAPIVYKLFGKSKHNSIPSRAVDLLPYPINRDNREQIAFLAGHMRMAAIRYGINLRWGGDRLGKNLGIGAVKNKNRAHHYELI